jgi:hypothetical protein
MSYYYIKSIDISPVGIIKKQHMLKKTIKYIQITLALVLIIAPFAVSAETVSLHDSFVSENWAGYTTHQDGSKYTAVGGSWIVPKSSTPVPSGEATWVGLGGFSTPDLIQVGTLNLIDSEGASKYYAWYELLPDPPVTITMEVRPGDSMTASIVPLITGNNQWIIYIKNNTTGIFFQDVVTYKSSLTSAEWIEEVPTSAIDKKYLALSYFSKVNFTNAWVVQDGVRKTINEARSNPMYLLDYDRNIALAVPSALSNNGTAFSVTRTSAAGPQTQTNRYNYSLPSAMNSFTLSSI